MSYRENTIEPVQPARCDDGSVGYSTQGLILPAGSSLVQFEIQRPPRDRGQVPAGWKFPYLVWVNRTPEPRIQYKCTCSNRVWKVSQEGLPGELRRIFSPGVTCVCSCMGRFVE